MGIWESGLDQTFLRHKSRQSASDILDVIVRTAVRLSAHAHATTNRPQLASTANDISYKRVH